MTTKTKKTFDCVEMKRQAQEGLLREFERRKGEFATYFDFIQAKVSESPWASEMMARIPGGKRRSGPRRRA